MRMWIFAFIFLLGGCKHQKVVEREKVRVKKRMTQISDAYRTELELANRYCGENYKQRQIVRDALRELVMTRGESYQANYQLMIFDRYRAYPFLNVTEDLNAKIRYLKSRAKLFVEDEQHEITLLIAHLENLRTILLADSQYGKECKRYESLRLVESAVDFAEREIEDLRERVLTSENRLNLLTEN